eukprot:contig_5518_g1253
MESLHKPTLHHEAVVAAVLDAGADGGLPRNDGVTPLIVAAQEGHGGVVRLLLQAGVEASVTAANGDSAVEAAVRNGLSNICEAPLDAHEDDGRTPLFEAACHGVLAIARALLAAGADVHRTCTPSKAVPLHLAAQEEAVEMVALLLEAGALVDVADATDETPIFFAARKDHPAVVDALVAAGAA